MDFFSWDMIGGYALYAILVIVVALLGLFFFRKRGILDRPGHDRIPPRLFKVPNFQGIILIIGFWIGLLLVAPQVLEIKNIAWLLYLATAYGIFNFINDIVDYRGDMTGIPPLVRLVVQIIFVGICVRASDMYQHISLFGYSLPLWFSFLFAWFWILGFINAINFFDGVQGMTAGVTGLGYIAVAILIQTVVIIIYNLMGEDLQLMNTITHVCILLAISCFVYAGVEYKPSGVLRDVGLSFIGFTLGALSLLGGAKIGTMFLILFLPICDSIWVFLNRIFVMKKNPTKGDYTHLHHRLMKLGLSRPEIRMIVRLFTITMLFLLFLLGGSGVEKLFVFAWLAFLFFGTHVYVYRIKKMPFELLKKEKKQ